MSKALQPGSMIVLITFSPLYIAEQGYNKIPVNYLDFITRQTFEYANQIPCENNH